MAPINDSSPRSAPSLTSSASSGVIAYVLKRYPRYSETFVVNEILAHEEAGQEIVIFSLLAPEDGHFQDAIARVRAPVVYLPAAGVRSREFWSAVEGAGEHPEFDWSTLREGCGEDPRLVYQALRLASEIRKRGVRHLHAHFASAATTVARLAASFARVPYSFTAHAKDIFHESVRHDDLAKKISDASHTVTVSRFNLDHLRKAFPVQTANLVRVANGLLLERFPFDSPTERSPEIIAVARLVEKKGLDLLIESMGQLHRQGLRATCRIIGQGPLEAELADQIKRLGLEDVVRLEGPRPQPEVAEAVSRAAVLAAPCRIGTDGNRDGLPTVLLEAMALGTPCVATPVTGIPELVEDEVSGLIVPEEDAAALTRALRRVLTDAALRCRLAQAGRARIEDEYDVRKNSAAIRRIFAMAAEPSTARVG